MLHLRRDTLPLLAVLAVAAAGVLWPFAFPTRAALNPPSVSAVEPRPAPSQALLIGVTAYPHLDTSRWLHGGENDVLLMRDLLREKFGFPKQSIVILSEAEGKKDPARLPTRPNIERECRRLAREARAGGRTVVFLSGHGSRQPERADEPDPRPDGMERIFLPRDITAWNAAAAQIPGAITGRELGAWLRPIPEKKARLWVIVDSCHAGEMLRGVGETVRQLDPVTALKVPLSAITAAQRRAAAPLPVTPLPSGERGNREGRQVPPSWTPHLANLEGVALIYACQGHEVTIEKNFPPGAENARPYGLLTYTLNRVLRPMTEPVSYRELLLRIQKEYVALNRNFPMPLLEGAAQRQALLGSEQLDRVLLVVTREARRLMVNAGQLHGLTTGSILRVHPPPGDKGPVRGYIRVIRVNPTRAEVEPCAHAGMPAPMPAVLLGGRCEAAVIDYGELRIEVSLDRLGSRASADQLATLAGVLKALAGEETSPISFISQQERASWLVRLVEGKVFLVRGAEWVVAKPEDVRALPLVFGPYPLGDGVGGWLRDNFGRLARAQNLLKLAARPLNAADDSDPFRARARLEVTRVGVTASSAAAAGGVVPRFYDGDVVHFLITNTGKVPIDVTLLYVGSTFAIEPLFPLDEHNRIQPGKTLRVPPVAVQKQTTGREYVVLIAVKAEGMEPVDFVSLAQKGIDAALRTERSRGRETTRGLGSPLGLLLRSALYRDGATRSMSRRQTVNYFLELTPVQVEPGRRPASPGGAG